ncbi:MAG: outer membrane protein assembly factor BamD [Azoarcus sp.]|nr:outer membrane protein assembly factor BamD [Azoarcus sp.]
MIRRPFQLSVLFVPLALSATLAACGRGVVAPAPTAPEPILRVDASVEEVDRQWARAERLFRSGKWADAATALERLNLEFASGDPRIARSRFYLGECHFQMKSHLQAVREFRRVSDDLPSDPLAADALLRAADAFADLWRRPELDPTYAQTAIGTYQEVQNRYPGTHAATLAQVRVEAINDQLAVKQYRAALYYIRYKADDSAILYLKDLASTYPRARIVPTALVTLIGVYSRLGYVEDIRETCTYLRRFHPQGEGVEAACRATPPAGTS